MGVDAMLYLPAELGMEHIATALCRAEGVDIPLTDGKVNPFTAKRFIRVGYEGALDYWVLEVDQVGVGGEFNVRHSFHMNSSERAFPSWLIMDRSRADILAVHEAVAEAFGGFSIWRDTDNVGQLFSRPETSGNWGAYTDLALGIEKATITAVHEERAAYKKE